MAQESVKIFKNYRTPSEPGKYYRMLCLTGKNKGLSYIFTKNRVVLGRSDNADIQVLDTKSSREHAELVKVGDVYTLSDLGSQNGIVVNDLKVSQHQLNDGDTIVIGQTVYKFSKLVVEEKNEVVPVNEDTDIAEFDEEQEETKKKGKKKPGKEDKKKNKKLLIYGVIGMALVLMLPDEKDARKVTKTASRIQRTTEVTNTLAELIEKKQKIEDKELSRKVDAYIHRGLREFRESNYFRAIEQFELALILDQNNGRASFYKNRTQQRLNEYIEKMFLKGKQDADALKYQKSMVSYCAVIALLQEHKDDERYKEAEENIEYLEEKLGYEKGEFKCF